MEELINYLNNIGATNYLFQTGKARNDNNSVSFDYYMVNIEVDIIHPFKINIFEKEIIKIYRKKLKLKKEYYLKSAEHIDQIINKIGTKLTPSK